MQRMTPTETAIKVFGNALALAAAAGVDPSRVSRWKRQRSRGESGVIPAEIQPRLLKVARLQGLPLTAEDLILGRSLLDPATVGA